MPRKLKLAVLLTLVMSFSATSAAIAQEVRSFLVVDATAGGAASAVKVVEVELRVIVFGTSRIRGDDMARIRELFSVPQPTASTGNSKPYGSGVLSNSQKLQVKSHKGPIKHQVLETKPFLELLSWLSTRQITMNAEHEKRRIALGSTVVVVDQRAKVPHLSKKKDPRTGAEVHTIEFLQKGLHLELTAVGQIYPKGKGPGEVWMLKLDRIFTDRAGAKVDRVGHTVKLALGQTALIPNFVRNDNPAYVLLTVKNPKKEPKSDPAGTVFSAEPPSVFRPGRELHRLATEPGGPRLADRIVVTTIPGIAGARLPVAPPARVASKDPIPVAAPDLKFAGVTLRELKESEIPLRNGVRTLELYELERVLLLFPEKLSALTTSKNYEELFTIDAPGPSDLIIQAKKKGVGTLQVVKGKDAAGKTNTFRINVVVRGDTRLLSHTLENLFPNDSVELTEVNDALVIRGKVSQAVIAKQIVEVAEQFYPQILDQMEARDLEQFQTGKEATNPKSAPTIGTEIRQLRTDVKSLRDEIQKLIKVMENQADAAAAN